MAWMRNDPDGGFPGEGGRKASRARNRTLIATLDYLDRKEREDAQRVPYAQTHGPWEITRDFCVRCGESALEIHANRLTCKRGMTVQPAKN